MDAPNQPVVTTPEVSRNITNKIIEIERTEIHIVWNILTCLTDVLLHSDDDNAVMHSNTCKMAADLLFGIHERLATGEDLNETKL